MAAATESFRAVKMEENEECARGMEAGQKELEKDLRRRRSGGDANDDDDGDIEMKPSSSSAPAAAKEDEQEEELNAYELERERNIARNRARMEAVVGFRRTRTSIFSATTSSSSTSRQTRRRRPRPPSSPQAKKNNNSSSTRTMPTRASRRLNRSSRSPSPPPPMSTTPPDCRGRSGLVVSRSAKPVIPSRFVRGMPSSSSVAADDAEALRELNEFRASYMSRAALFNRVMAVSNLRKLEDFAAVLERDEATADLAALAREKLSLMKGVGERGGDPRAVREFVLKSKEAEYERRERQEREREEREREEREREEREREEREREEREREEREEKEGEEEG